MLCTSDIPEWCSAESLKKKHSWHLTPDDY